MIDKATIEKLMMHYSHLGTRTVEATGAVLIGHAPHIAPEAWLNSMYPCLTEQETVELEKDLGTIIPPEYRHFLQNISNGMELLVSTLCLHGKRSNYIRSSTDASRQPFNLSDIQLYERPQNASEDMFFFASYNWDGSKLYIDKKNNRIYFCERYDSTPLKSWNSLEEMLLDEIPRLYSLFDENGVAYDKSQSTLPIGKDS